MSFSLNPMTTLNRAILSAALGLFLAFTNNSSAQNVQRWIHPGFGVSPNADPNDNQLSSPDFVNESTYPTALRDTDVFQFFVEDLARATSAGTFRDRLATRIQIFKKHGTRISVTDGGPNAVEGYAWNPIYPNNHYCEFLPGGCTASQSDTVAQESAKKVLWKIQPVYDLGGSVSYITIDGAGLVETLENGHGDGTSVGGHMSLADSIQTLVKYMSYVHTGVQGLPGRPEIKFGLVIAMPNVRYQGTPAPTGAHTLNDLDFYDVLSQMVNTVKAAGETLWSVHSDSPYNYTFPPYTADHLDRLIWLRNQCQGLNLRYGAIFNTECGTDQCYTEETLSYIQQYRARTNGQDPDDFIIENWYNTPAQTFPETTEYTFMNLVKKVADPNLYQTFWGYDHRHSRQLDTDIFNWHDYLLHYPDLANWVNATFGNQQRFGAEWHWLTFGVNEGRRGAWTFSAPWYLANNPDLAPFYGPQDYAGAIDHYFYAGRNEGRAATCTGCAW
jgi:hypothetical protein